MSMVIETSRNKKACVLGMAIGDIFFKVLANRDKIAHLRDLDVSKCNKITESALSLLLASPFYKGLAVLKINGLPLPDHPSYPSASSTKSRRKELLKSHPVAHW